MKLSEIKQVVSEINADLQAMADKSTPSVRQLRRKYTKRLSRSNAQEMLEVAFELLRHPSFIHRFFSYELISHHRDAVRSLGPEEIKTLGSGMDSWGAVDCFSVYVSGPAWREGQIPDALIRSWARSPDRWLRRAALVSTVPLNAKSRGGEGDTARTLGICGMLLQDRDDMVVKAMSWALRELAKRNPEAARTFVEENEGTLANRVVREVGNKLTTGLKNPRGQRNV